MAPSYFGEQHRETHLCPKGLTNRKVKLPKMPTTSSTSAWSSGLLFVNLGHTKLGSDADKFSLLYDQVSEHDRMIVDRMVRRRRNDLAMMEESQIARRYWEEERRVRQQEQLEQNEIMTRMMKERREQDTNETMMRLDYLRNRDRFLTERLRDELVAKEYLLDVRLAKINDTRDHQTNEKRLQHQERSQLIAHNNEESFLDQKLQQQMIIDQLEDKIHRAEYQRQRYIDAQRARVQLDNEIEQKLHQARMTENQRYEAYQRQKLLDSVRRSDQKTRLVLNNKQRELEESRNHARNSAFLRDFVRRSFTPDVNCLLGGGGGGGTAKLFSTRSFKSV